eukprot:RCo045599
MSLGPLLGPGSALDRHKARVADPQQCINVVWDFLFPGEHKPPLNAERVDVQRVLPNGTLLDLTKNQAFLRRFRDLGKLLEGISSPSGEWKVEVIYKNGKDSSTPFGSKSADSIVFKLGKCPRRWLQ